MTIPAVGDAPQPGLGGLSTPRPLRIAFCISRTFERFQGTYGRYCGQARLLRDLGHDVTVFAVNREMKLPEDEIHFGVRVHRVPVRSQSWGGPKNFSTSAGCTGRFSIASPPGSSTR